MVHQYQLNGFNIVLDSCSGAIHVVDEVAYDIIAMIKEKNADEITAEIMAKYGHREDVTEEEVRLCIGMWRDSSPPESCTPPIPLPIWPVRSRSVPEMW